MTRRSLSVMSALHALTMHRGRGDSANVMPAEKLPTTARTCPDLALEASPSLRGHVLGRFRPLATTLPVPLERIGGLDALRIIAAVGIVWFHTEGAPYRQVGYAGLPIFLVIFFCLITRRSSAETAAHFLRRRCDRLLRPWLFWSAVYGACRLAKACATTDWASLSGMISIKTVLTGTSIHLWYLPYAFISGFLVYAVNRWTARINYVVVVFTAAALGVFLLITSALQMSAHRLMEPLPQWEFGLASIPLGFAIGRCLLIPFRQAQRRLLSLIAVLTVAVCAVLVSLGFSSPAVAYGLAIIPVSLACVWQSKSNGLTTALAPLTFGVYLIHPLIAFGLKAALGIDQDYAAFITLTVCISGLVTWGLIKTPLRGFV